MRKSLAADRRSSPPPLKALLRLLLVLRLRRRRLQVGSRRDVWNFWHVRYLASFSVAQINSSVFEEQAGGSVQLELRFLICRHRRDQIRLCGGESRLILQHQRGRRSA